MEILTNQQLWAIGVPLERAWLEFANADAKRRYSELTTLADFAERAKATKIQSGLDLMNLYSSGLRQWSQWGELQNELREMLLGNLFNDELQAYAYRILPSRSRVPVRIAPELFDLNDPDWQHQTLRARGVEYAEIRIIDPARISGFQKHRAGRKGSAQAIRDAISVLQSEGFDLCGIDRKLACEAIRNRIGNNNSKGSGLSNQNLAKYILEKCPRRGIDI